MYIWAKVYTSVLVEVWLLLTILTLRVVHVWFLSVQLLWQRDIWKRRCQISSVVMGLWDCAITQAAMNFNSVHVVISLFLKLYNWPCVVFCSDFVHVRKHGIIVNDLHTSSMYIIYHLKMNAQWYMQNTFLVHVLIMYYLFLSSTDCSR